MPRMRLAFTLLVLAASIRTAAAGEDTEAATAEPDVPLTVDSAAVSTLLDEFVPSAMSEADIPGVAIAVVHAGEIVTLAGYGQADVEAGLPVDPERTVFRLGSISKPLTATTILALLEHVDFDLDRDVRPLLDDFDLRPGYPGPLTLRQLLTHTGGFNENLFGQHARRPEDWLPLDRYLARRLSLRFAPPGEVIAYTDFHTSLAGLVAARLADSSFEDLADELLFTRLGMTSSSFRQVDLPAELTGRLARSYGRRGGERFAYARDFIHTTPAAGVQSTAADMARYLIALLEDGVVDPGTGTVMSPASWRTQKTVHHRHHDRLSGKALGLTEVRHGGRTLLYKNGQASGFNARLLLAPEDRLAVFSVHNRSILDPMGAFNAASRFHTKLGWALFDALLPEVESPPPPESLPAAGSAARLAAYEGTYRTTVASRHTAEKVISIMDELEVHRLEDDRLRIAGGTYVEIEPGLAQYEGARFFIAFAPPQDGLSPYAFVGAGAYERIPWYESSASTIRFALTFLSLQFALALFFAVRARRASGPDGRRLALRALAAAVPGFLFLIGFVAIFAVIDIQTLFHGWPSTMKALLALPVAGALAMLLLLLSLRSADARSQAGRWTTRLAALLLVTGVAFLWWLDVWNLLGWRL